MGRSPCCSKDGMNKGAWTAQEDQILTDYINTHGEGKWRNLPKQAGLKRCGKRCRLRWLNYLRPDIKRGNISEEEEDLIIRLHKLLGNRWSLIAGRLPGRTDNEVKNYWNTTLRKKIKTNPSNKVNDDQRQSLTKQSRSPAIIQRTKPVDPQPSRSSLDASFDLEKPEESAAMANCSFQNLVVGFDVDEFLPSDVHHDDLWKLCSGVDDHDHHEFDLSDGYRLPSASSAFQPILFSEEMLLECWTDV